MTTKKIGFWLSGWSGGHSWCFTTTMKFILEIGRSSLAKNFRYFLQVWLQIGRSSSVKSFKYFFQLLLRSGEILLQLQSGRQIDLGVECVSILLGKGQETHLTHLTDKECLLRRYQHFLIVPSWNSCPCRIVALESPECASISGFPKVPGLGQPALLQQNKIQCFTFCNALWRLSSLDPHNNFIPLFSGLKICVKMTHDCMDDIVWFWTVIVWTWLGMGFSCTQKANTT